MKHAFETRDIALNALALHPDNVFDLLDKAAGVTTASGGPLREPITVSIEQGGDPALERRP